MSEKDRIKSAVELALERTADRKASREEMKALREKELKDRARIMVSRYLNGEKTFRDLFKELDEADETERDPFRPLVFEELLSSLEMGADWALAVEALAALAKGEASESIENLKTLLQDFDDHNAQARAARAAAILDELKDRGVWGTGIAPNLREDEEWLAITKKMQSGYQPKLERLSADLLEKAV